jgi:hypothetical protein
MTHTDTLGRPGWRFCSLMPIRSAFLTSTSIFWLTRRIPAPPAAPRTAAVSQPAGGALLLSTLRGQQAVWTQQYAGFGQWGAPPPASRSSLRRARGQHGPSYLDDRHRRRAAPPAFCRGAPLEPHTPRTVTPSTLGSSELARGSQTARVDEEEEQGGAPAAQRRQRV